MRRSVLQIIALLPLPLLAAVLIWTGRRPVEQPPLPAAGKGHQANSAQQAVRLPATLTGGWKLQGEPVRYDEKTLFDRIDGAAPAYLRAGFVYSLGADYRQEGQQEPVVVDVYDMGTTRQGLGMYATERDRSYRFIEVGDEGYLASGSLNFWRGRFYVKLAGFEEGEAMDRALTGLAAVLSAALPVDPAVRQRELAPLALLPAEGRLPHGAGYSHPPLGEVEGLERAFYADYQEGEQIMRLFLIQETNAGGARARYDKARAYFQRDKAKVSESAEQGGQLLRVSGDSAASVLLLAQRTLVGALDLPAPALEERALVRMHQAVELVKAPAASAGKGGAGAGGAAPPGAGRAEKAKGASGTSAGGAPAGEGTP